MGWVQGCRGVITTPDPGAIPGMTEYNTERKVLSVRWRAPLFEPEETRLPLGPPAGKSNAASDAKSPARTEPVLTIDADPVQYGTPSVSPDGKKVVAGGTDGTFYCMDANDGTVIWRHFLSGPIDGQPTVTDDTVFVGSGDSIVYAFRLSDGEQIWSQKSNGLLDGKPVLVGDRLLVMSDTNTLVCLEAKTGKLLWSYHREVPSGRFQVKGVATPLVNGGNVYAGFSDGTLAVLSLEDGSVQILKDFSRPRDRFTDIDTNPILANRSLLVGSVSQGIFALEPTDLSLRWNVRFEGPSSFAIDSERNMLWVSTSQSKVLAIRLDNGKILWSFDAHRGSLSKPVLSGGYLFISSSEYSLFVLDSATGKLEQTINPGKGSYSSPTIFGNKLYWVSNGQIVYCMNISN